jgi:ATP-dependent Clp protease ATP-binding subunit ClpA
VFERFTDSAKQVVVLAQDEARQLAHNYIGTEHILLGLLRVDGLGGQALESLGVTFDEVRDQVARIVGQGDEPAPAQIPFTPRAKKVLELSLHEALALGHKYIGTEHILLGLARENEGVAARILLDGGVDAERIREEMGRALAGSPEPTHPEAGTIPTTFMSRALWHRQRRDRWAYLVVSAKSEELNDVLNSNGEVGWELGAAWPEGDEIRLVLKKPA